MTLHPIHCCLILNASTLVGAGVLAFVFSQPWLFVVAILLCNHALERFRDEHAERENDEAMREYEGGGAGFTADISKR